MVVLRCPDCNSVNMQCNKENEQIVCNDCKTVHEPYKMDICFCDLELPAGLTYIDYLALNSFTKPHK